MTAALAFPDIQAKPFDLESAIAELVASELPAMREREMQEMCAQVRKDEFADFVALDRERRGWRREHDAERKMGER